MADVLRPAARAALWRWREVALALAVAGFGFWAGLRTFGFVSWISFALAAFGLALTLVAVQRLRFAGGAGGAGLVEVDERQLSYFGPLSGGIMALGDLVRVDLDPTGRPAHWVLTDQAGQLLHIPVNAAGAEALFDLFAALPGIRTGRMLEALRGRPAQKVLIWQAAQARLPPERNF